MVAKIAFVIDVSSLFNWHKQFNFPPLSALSRPPIGYTIGTGTYCELLKVTFIASIDYSVFGSSLYIADAVELLFHQERATLHGVGLSTYKPKTL